MGLERFKEAQSLYYGLALGEIEYGYKESHWIWFIFPQLKGLGQSERSKFYGIDGQAEACEYIADIELRDNLVRISEALLRHKGRDIVDIVGEIDSEKLQSCMTLFDYVSNEEVFSEVLEAFYDGERDPVTLGLLKETTDL